MAKSSAAPPPWPAASPTYHGRLLTDDVSLQVGDPHGIRLDPATGTPQFRRYVSPLVDAPLSLPDFYGREEDLQQISQFIEARKHVQIVGAAGIGKTWFLLHLAEKQHYFRDLVFINAAYQSLDDLLFTIFERVAYAEARQPSRPTPAQLKETLRRLKTLLLIDNLNLSAAQLQNLIAAVPKCTLVFTAGLPIDLKACHLHELSDLDEEGAVSLLAKKLGQPITGPNREIAARICQTLAGHPERIIQVGYAIRHEEQSLATFAARLAADPEALPDLAQLTPAAQSILLVFSAIGNAPLTPGQVGQISGEAAGAQMIETLRERGLIKADPVPYFRPSAAQKLLRHLARFEEESIPTSQLKAFAGSDMELRELLQKLEQEGFIRLDNGAEKDSLVQRTPLLTVITQLVALGGGPVTLGRLIARTKDPETEKTLAALSEKGWILIDMAQNNQLTYRLAPPQQVLLLLSGQEKSGVTAVQLNRHLSSPEIAHILKNLSAAGWVDIVTRIQAAATVWPILAQKKLASTREKAHAFFIDQGRSDPHSPIPEVFVGYLAAVTPAVQNLASAALQENRAADTLQLVTFFEGVLALNQEWSAWSVLLQQGLTAAQALGNNAAEAWLYHQLGIRARCQGDKQAAIHHLTRAYRMRQQTGEKEAAALTWHNLNPLLHPVQFGPAKPALLAPPLRRVDSRWLQLAMVLAVFILSLVLIRMALTSQDGTAASESVAESGQGGAPTTDVLESLASPQAELNQVVNPEASPTPLPSTTPLPANTPLPSATPLPSTTPLPTATPCVVQQPRGWVRTAIIRGDTLSELARKHNTSIDRIENANCLRLSGLIAGQSIWLPYIPPTPTPTPFLAINQVQQAGNVTIQDGSIKVPLTIQMSNDGGSGANPANIVVLFDNGTGEYVAAPVTIQAAGLAPGQAAAARADLFLSDDYFPSLPANATILVRGDNQSAPVSIYLVPPVPEVRIDFVGGAPLTAFDGQAEIWHTSIDLAGNIENASIFQDLTWQWTGTIGSETIAESGPTFSRTIPSDSSCIPYNISLTVRGSTGNYPATASANVQSQCN